MNKTESEVAEIVVRARLRRERRIRIYMTMSARVLTDPIAAHWLDLVHEATYLIDRLERRQQDLYDAAAERYWTDVYTQA